MMVESIKEEVEEAKEIRRQKAEQAEAERQKKLEKVKLQEKEKKSENSFSPGFVEGLPTTFLPGTGVIQRGINFVRQLSVSSDHPQRKG